jgi:hypothetical protein
MPEKDPVLIDEARHDREQTAQEMLEEMGMDQAMDEFYSGELNDEIIDAVADYPIDAVNIALAATFPKQLAFSACERDFRVMVQGIIIRRAREITENK